MAFLKYDLAVSASDPLLKCDDCKKIVAKKWLETKGSCNHCGNRRFKTIGTIDSEDMKALKLGTYDLGLSDYTVDPKFLELFGEQEVLDV